MLSFPRRRESSVLNGLGALAATVTLRLLTHCHMKTVISIPDPVFRSAEELAQRLGISRSELYSKAVAEFIERHRDDLVTHRLNEVHGAGGDRGSLEQEVAWMQHRSLA